MPAPRIEPVTEPYTQQVADSLKAMMGGKDQEPIRLFRTFARNLPMADGLHAWGRYYFSRQLSLNERERELVIDRTTARCGCDYEWGVHIALYSERVALTPDQVLSIAHGEASDPCWDVHDAVLIEAIDALHDHATIDDELWPRLAGEFTEAQILDITLLSGWYHAISFAANASRVELEDWAPKLNDVRD